MKRILLALATFFLFAVAAQAQPACTQTINADYATVSAAVATALAGTGGDVICLNAGDMTGANRWLLQVALGNGTKCVEVRGAGTMPTQGSAGQTIIEIDSANGTPGGGAAFYGFDSSGSSHCTVDNIKFVFNENDAVPFSIVGCARTYGDGKPCIFHHNDFVITGRCDAPEVISFASHGGIVYRNKFSTEIMPGVGCLSQNTNINAVHHIITDDGSWWSSARTTGTSDTTGFNNLYVENNLFTNFNVAIDANSSARDVWRFNTMENSSYVDHGYDSSPNGVRQGEIYNNTWTCTQALSQGTDIGVRGGTYLIFGNTHPVRNALTCGLQSTTASPINVSAFKLIQCDYIGGWPGVYNATPNAASYPQSHQPGWGWIFGSNITVGASTAQGQPGLLGYPTDGFQQALDPYYIFNNTNNSGNTLLNIRSGDIGTCRAMAYSNAEKTSDIKLVIPSASADQRALPYADVGEEAVVVFSDLVGGSTPTVADSLGNSWSALTGGTNGSMRLTAWHSHITNKGPLVVTISFGSSSAARAASLVIMRGMTASPVDVNPAVATDNTSPYDGPSSGTLAQTNEIVLGYYALNGPTSYNHSNQAFENDAYTVAAPDNFAMSCLPCTGEYNIGVMGTTGSTATTNVTVGVTYRSVSSTSAVQPRLSNGTADRNGITGTIAFKVTSNDNTNLDLQSTDFIQLDREIYNQNDSFTGTSGTGSGPLASRPASTTNGVGYWDTDHGGNWNTTNGSANDGCLDIVVSGSWSNCVYTPADYPHTLATVTGSGGDSTVPTAGASGAITFASVTSSSITVNWTKGTDDTSAQGALQYEVCRSASTISSVGTCESNIVLSFTTDIATYADSGLSSSTTYHYNVVVKDEAGNKTLYVDNSQATSSGSITGSGRRRFHR